ncbi:hypothetical protein [Lelliottia nimipressuralis]|uniref:hypothetical protein n=1 Tax=Lelliottia nimipressuralis TaxID=69220 RepID=UPI003D2DE582
MFIKIMKKIAFTIPILLCIGFFIEIIRYSIEIPYHDLMLFFGDSDFFWFDGRHLAMLAGVPALAYGIIIIAFVPFTKANKAPKVFNYSGNLLGLVSIIFLVLFNILSLFIYLYVSFFTPYQICKEPPVLSHYFATDPAICKTIVNHDLS